ncbi:hypothetical protein F200043G1_07510 [[Clostridium] innocuum]
MRIPAVAGVGFNLFLNIGYIVSFLSYSEKRHMMCLLSDIEPLYKHSYSAKSLYYILTVT